MLKAYTLPRPLSHQATSSHRIPRVLVAALLTVITLTAGIGGPLSGVGSAYADTTASSTCGTVTAYTAATSTTAGSLSLKIGSATSATTSTIAPGAAWAGIPIVVGANICVSATLDTTGALTGGTVTGATVTPSSGLFTTGPYIFARAKLMDDAGNFSGTATLAQDTATGLVYVSVTVFNPALTAGLHGIHIHSVASCVGPTFASAGVHFNPLDKQHGLDNPNGPHAGDLPNISVNSNGSGDLEAVSNLFTLSAGTTSLFDGDGSSIVVHSGTDDQMTDPSGNSDGRVLCGVIQTG
jgi:Cu-Zn family superoxide dismutase